MPAVLLDVANLAGLLEALNQAIAVTLLRFGFTEVASSFVAVSEAVKDELLLRHGAKLHLRGGFGGLGA